MTTPESATKTPSGPARRGRIMVIDDDSLVRVSLGHILSFDYEVTLCASGHEALTRLGGGERFDAILCDLNMPAMDGQDVYDAMRGLAPDQLQRTIFLTGGAFTLRAQAFLARIDNEQMEKPFDYEALRAAIARVMA